MKKRNIIAFSVTVILLIMIGIIVNGYIEGNNNTKNTRTIFYSVPKEASTERLAEDFISKGIIQGKLYFKLYSKYMKLDNNIRNSRIMIGGNMPLSELIFKLMSDQPDFAVITIPEGFRLYQIAERLEKNQLVNKDIFVNLNINDLEGENLIPERKDVILDLEGFLFPDTYFIPYTFTEKDIAGLMFSRFKAVFTESHINRAKELGLSINEVIAIASMIEREALNDSERSRISGVIYNRLKKGMLLQIDAAVIYANTKGEGHLTKVFHSHLKYDSKYNNYVYKGLPPGPIASPGRPSIEAALYPEQHDYLYYVASEDGHVFSKTYQEHQANVKKYIKK
jgi:UPF0755 protein